MMKKLLAVFLAVALGVSLVTSALAVDLFNERQEEEPSGGTVTVDKTTATVKRYEMADTQDEDATLTATADQDAAYQWQILVPGTDDLWVNIYGQTENTCTLTYAMVSSLLDGDETQVRCVATAGEEKSISEPISVRVLDNADNISAPEEDYVPARVPLMPSEDEVNDADAFAPDEDEIAGEETYTIVIHYIFEDGSQAANPWTATIAKGSDYAQSITSPTVVGYEPSQSTVEIDIKGIQEDATYTVTYSPAKVNFTVKHYQQNVDDDHYTLADTETKAGYTESAVGTDLAKSYDGFYALLYDTTTKIAADGSTEVEIYYDRYYYLMTFDLDGGYGVEPIYARYGTPIEVGTPTKAGYSFSGWDSTIPATMPASNKSYKASWTPGESGFTVVFWYENADDDGYSVAGSYKPADVAPGTSKSSDDYQNQQFTGQDTEHFTYNASKAETVTVAGDGSTVLNVYYTRNIYTLTFTELNCGDNFPWHTHTEKCYKQVAEIIAKYDAKISEKFKEAPFNTTYAGRAWECTESNKYDYALQTLDRMPGFDATFKLYDQSSRNKKIIYYYVQKIGSTINSDSWPTDKTQFDLLKQVDTYFNYATYDEEYHEIQGFSRYSASVAGFNKNGQLRKDFSNNKLDLYYMRNSYSLQFYNYSNFVESQEQTVQYQAPLTNYRFIPEYPTNLEANAYQFEGWYTTAECYDGSEADLDTMTMPASDLILYAKWAPKTHVVKTYLTKDAMTEEPLQNQEVSHGSFATKPENPTNGEYIFVGWFYEENGVEKAFDFDNMPVNKDLDLYAKWSSNKLVEYTIYYKLEDGTVIASETKGSALAGSTKTFDAKGGMDLNEGYQSGYFPQTNSHSITMDINGGNEFTFVYVPREKVAYTVRYLEKGTNAVLHEEKHAETPDAVITEKFEAITGYRPDAYQKRLVLSADEEENVLTFWYEADTTRAPVRIIHWTQNAVGNGYTEYRSSTDLNGVIGQIYTETPLEIPGFVYNASKSTASGELTGDGLELNLYYDRESTSLTIRKTFKDDEGDQNQTFIFKVKDSRNNEIATVMIQGAGSTTISGLDVGKKYTVTEEKNWSWRYTPTQETEEITLTASGENTVTFENRKSNHNWLSALASAINTWTEKTITTVYTPGKEG